jgi:general secretion pathway protein C
MLRKVSSPNTGQGHHWPARLITLLVWTLAVASAAYWGLRILGPSANGAPVAVAGATLSQADATAVARVLGSTPQVAAVAAGQSSTRYVLTGVVADRRQGGAALIAVNGLPPKPYRVGAEVEPGVVLTSVGPRRAVLAPDSQAEPVATLELPALLR